MEHLNFFCILIKSFTISWKKIFTQITIATISELLISHTLHKNEGTSWSEETAFLLFNMVYVVSLVALYMLASSLVVHVVARVYTTKEARGVVPRVKVWKRAMVTFGWNVLLIAAYDVAALLLLLPWTPGSTYELIPGPAFSLYVLGYVYVSIVWHLEGVVSVLGEDCGVEALSKSMAMVKGRMVISSVVFMLLNLCFVWVQVLLERFVVDGDEMVWRRVGCGIVCFVSLFRLTLLGLVVQIVVYFVCKLCGYEEMIHESFLENQHHVVVIMLP